MEMTPNDALRERVAKIKARYEATTGGPWGYNSYSTIWAFDVPEDSAFYEDAFDKDDPDEGSQHQIADVYAPYSLEGPGDIARSPEQAANAEFIAEAHQDIPFLLDAILALLDEGKIPAWKYLFVAREPRQGAHLCSDGEPCQYLGSPCNKCGFVAVDEGERVEGFVTMQVVNREAGVVYGFCSQRQWPDDVPAILTILPNQNGGDGDE